MTALRTQHEDPALQTTDRRTQGHGGGPAIVILGCCHGDAFVADKVLICADTLGAEEAIRAWLAEHDIHVTASNGKDGPPGPHRRPATKTSDYSSEGSNWTSSGEVGVPPI